MNNLIEKEQENMAMQILDLQNTMDELEVELKSRKELLLNAMIKSGIKTIKTTSGKSFIATERNNDKVDVDNATEYLIAKDQYDDFVKLDESKFKKVFPDSEFIIRKEPTIFLTIK